jgi:protein TonB
MEEPTPQPGQDLPSPEPTAQTPRPPVLTPPRPIATFLPQYPGAVVLTVRRSSLSPEAVLGAPEGRVRLRLLVRADGTVGSVEVLVSSGFPELDRAAQDALRRWRFEPATRDGVPIDAYYLVWVTFEVHGP